MALTNIVSPVIHQQTKALSDTAYRAGTRVAKEFHRALGADNVVWDKFFVKEVRLSPKNKLQQLGIDRFICSSTKPNSAERNLFIVDKNNKVLMGATSDTGFKAIKDFIKKLKGI